MKYLLLICGYSFSGKSTLANKISEELLESKVISLDKINLEKGFDISDDISLDDWEQTHQIAIEEIKKSKEKYLIIDDTNMFKKHRDRFSEAGSYVGYNSVIIWVNIPIKVVRERYSNSMITDRHRPPRESFEYVIENLEKPSAEENYLIYEPDSDFTKFMDQLRAKLK